MKKYIISIVCVCLFASLVNATDTRAVTKTVRSTPYGVRVYDLHTRNTNVSMDTLAAQNDNNIYGPYELCSDNDGTPTSFMVAFDAVTGTSPTMSFDYQVIGGTGMGDTISGAWIAADTLDGTSSYKNITIGQKGIAIAFRINNYDATESQIPGLLRVVIPAATTVSKNK